MRACARFLPNQAFKGLIVPSKFYSSIAAGQAVIFVGDGGNDRDGEIAREVARGDCGVTVAPDDAVALANAIERLCNDAAACARMGVMDTNARAMFDAEFTREMAMSRWRGVLNDVRGEMRGTGHRKAGNF